MHNASSRTCDRNARQLPIYEKKMKKQTKDSISSYLINNEKQHYNEADVHRQQHLNGEEEDNVHWPPIMGDCVWETADDMREGENSNNNK